MISEKTGCALIRTATVPRPAVTISGTISRFGKTIVNGPGQNWLANSKINCRSCAGTEAISSSQSRSGKWTIKGSKRGRSFASKIFATAIGLSASAARPYTVSVGKPTLSPARKSATTSTRSQEETISVFTSALAVRAPRRFAFSGMLPVFCGPCHRKARGC